MSGLFCRKLPENLADGEVFAMNESCLYFPCLNKRTESSSNGDNKSDA